MDYMDENVIEESIVTFAETISLKVKQLRRYVPKNTNPALTGAYIEELVRGFISEWIGNKMLCHGTFYTEKFCKSKEKPLQIDGIIFDPKVGPAIIKEGDFIVVHPAFCSNVIEIKTFYEPNLKKFEERLLKIHEIYMSHLQTYSIMGVVIYDKYPEKKSNLDETGCDPYYSYNYRTSGSCPIFILFKEIDGEYEPFKPGIESLIKAIFSTKFTHPNYF